LLADFAKAIPDATFLQIGANDGLTGDPIHHLIVQPNTRWRGILVEPVGHLFDQLSVLYRDKPLLQLDRAAIGESDGSTLIYRLDETPDSSLWLDQIPSLDPELVRRNASQFGQAEASLVTETVPGLSVDTLLRKYEVRQLDLLVIDTEGWDWRILRQFDLAALQPKLILYEHQHLSALEKKEADEFLRAEGYEWIATEEGDTVAWKRS
jgi:FkbM family methyltransferase